MESKSLELLKKYIYRSIRKIFPENLRRSFHLGIRFVRDFFSKHSRFMDLGSIENCKDVPIRKKIIQIIKKTETFDNKVNNLQLACKKLNGIVIIPGQLFSFWKIIGVPRLSSGYLFSRVIRNGILSKEVGGGLCQLSGVLYLFALESGLEILERHSHSIDIYQDEERFTPLGADAAVVYGYKDLRFRNNTKQVIVLECSVKKNKLYLLIRAKHPMPNYEVVFKKIKEDENDIYIQTSSFSVMEKSVYFQDLSRYRKKR